MITNVIELQFRNRGSPVTEQMSALLIRSRHAPLRRQKSALYYFGLFFSFVFPIADYLSQRACAGSALRVRLELSSEW